MRIVRETWEDEIIIEVICDAQDIEEIHDYLMPTVEFVFEGKPMTVCLRLDHSVGAEA